MIIDSPDSHFIFIYHPLALMGRKYTVYQGKEMTNGEVMEYWGKWIVLGSRSLLDELAEKLDPFVEDKKIPCIKYDRQPSRNLGVEECVMMVYSDKRERDKVWDILSRFGIKLKAWVTEKETMEMWKSGGFLLERWLASTEYDEKTKEAVRADAESSLSYIFNHPDEIFTPWQQ